MARISDIFGGEVVEASAPRAMVSGVNYTLAYDSDTSELIFTLITPPSSSATLGWYVIKPHPRDPEIAIETDAAFPARVAFNAITHPRAWRDRSGVTLWSCTMQVGGKTVDGVVGRLRAVNVSIATEPAISIPESMWSAVEITDFVQSGGVSGKYTVSVAPGISPVGNLELYASVSSLEYTTAANKAAIHTDAVKATIGGSVTVESGLAAGSTAHQLLLWNDEVSGTWQQASLDARTVTVQGVVDPSFPEFVVLPAITGTGYIGQVLSGTYSVRNAVSVALQWFRGTEEINGATGTSYSPVADDDQNDLSWLISATNANGTTVAQSNAIAVTYAPPVLIGSLSDITEDEETGTVVTFDAAAVFSGQNLTYSVSGDGSVVTINAASGLGSVSRSAPLAATSFTVTATNSGGSASDTFVVTINEAVDTITWPDDVATSLWPSSEVTDPDEATDEGFPGEAGHIKTTFSASIDNDPTGFTLRWAPLGEAATTSTVAVVPGTTQYSSARGTVGQSYTPKLWWRHTATDTFKLAGTHSAIAIQGLDVEPPGDEHPRTVYSAAELVTIKARVTAGTQPQRNAWLNTVLPAANSALNFTADPDSSYGFQNPGSQPGFVGYTRAEFTRNSRAAYASALAWRQTGDTRYANKAVQIMDDWARRSPQMEPDGRSHPGLHISSHLTQMLYAVDLMRGYTPWENVHQRFETWWRNEPMRNVRAVITEKMPGWPGNRQQVINNPNSETIWEGTNWLDHAMNCMLTAGTVFDDTDLVDEFCDRLSDYFIANWRIKKYPYGPGGASVACMVRDVNRVSNGELTGVSYTGYGTSSSVQALTTALHHGVNLFNRKTPQGVGYQEVIEQWFRWNYLNEEFRGTTNYEREATTHTNILEVANSRWNMSTQFKNFVANNRPWSNGLMESYPTYVRGNL